MGVVWAIENFKYYLYGKHFTVITDHQALISVLNASERSKTSQSRLTRWIDRLIPFHFDIKHLAGNKLGLIDYMSRNPVGIAIPPSEYDEEFVVDSNNAFINDLELIDKVILNDLANQNIAPHELIKKRAESKGLLNATSNTQSTYEHSKHSTHAQLRTKTSIQCHSKIASEQSALSQTKFLKTKQPVQKTVNCIVHSKMNRRSETRGFKGGFLPTELKSADPRGQNTKSATQWQGSSDREEILSDPRWHKKPPTKGMKANTNSPKQTNTEGNIKLQDAREVITKKKTEETRPKSNFPKIVFTDNQEEQKSPTEKKNFTEQLKTTSCQTENGASPSAKTSSCQTEIEVTSSSTQTKLSGEQQSEDEIWVSRVNPTKTTQEESHHNEVPPTMTKNTSLEASHEMITEGLTATIEKATNTSESEEDTPLFRKKLQRVLGVRFIAAATKKDRNLRPLINFVKKRDWEAIKHSYGPYWHNIRNRLHYREDCLLIDKRIVIPTQLRQTVLESLHLTHPGSAAMLDLCQHVWFPHIHRTIVHMAQNCKHCTEQDKNLKPIIGKKHSFLMEPVVEPNEEVQLDF